MILFFIDIIRKTVSVTCGSVSFSDAWQGHMRICLHGAECYLLMPELNSNFRRPARIFQDFLSGGSGLLCHSPALLWQQAGVVEN